MKSGHLIEPPELRTPAESLRPVVRWAGGKSVMVNELASLLPSKWNRYIEPMSGGAALFFHVRPARAVLADMNSDLITYYSVLRDNPIELIRRLQSMTASREYYYALRESSQRGRVQLRGSF